MKNKPKITIVGAGLSGLLAANMLRDDFNIEIIEKQSYIPNNHKALLRFRTPYVGQALNFPFKEVKIMKAIHPHRNPVADALSYSHKCLGEYRARSITENLDPKRYIAPDNLVSIMADRVYQDILFEFEAKFEKTRKPTDSPIINTSPMPSISTALDYNWGGPAPGYRSVSGRVYRRQISRRVVDAYVTVYDPDPDTDVLRASITGNTVIIESRTPHELNANIENAIVRRGIDILGLYPGISSSGFESSHSKYAKIAPIEENLRRAFIMDITRKYNIYSLGRFATWRPGLLLDDVVKDIERIRNAILNKNLDLQYDSALGG